MDVIPKLVENRCNNTEGKKESRRRARSLQNLKRTLSRLVRGRSSSVVNITEYDPTYKVVYLGNVLTGWAKGEACTDKPLSTLWKNYTSNSKADVAMKLTVTQCGLKAITKEHGLTEYWSHRITYCSCGGGEAKELARIFCWIYRHEGRKLKQELRCHAVLCSNESTAKLIATELRSRITRALIEFKRDKISRQNARLSLANAVYDNPSLPRRKILLSPAGHNYRPPLERSRSAPKLMSIEECVEEEADVKSPPPQFADDWRKARVKTSTTRINLAVTNRGGTSKLGGLYCLLHKLEIKTTEPVEESKHNEDDGGSSDNRTTMSIEDDKKVIASREDCYPKNSSQSVEGIRPTKRQSTRAAIEQLFSSFPQDGGQEEDDEEEEIVWPVRNCSLMESINRALLIRMKRKCEERLGPIVFSANANQSSKADETFLRGDTSIVPLRQPTTFEDSVEILGERWCLKDNRNKSNKSKQASFNAAVVDNECHAELEKGRIKNVEETEYVGGPRRRRCIFSDHLLSSFIPELENGDSCYWDDRVLEDEPFSNPSLQSISLSTCEEPCSSCGATAEIITTPILQEDSDNASCCTTTMVMMMKSAYRRNRKYDLDSLWEEESDESGYAESCQESSSAASVDDDKVRDVPHRRLIKNCILTTSSSPQCCLKI